ncbi:MAG TPA: hypothetical protein VK841_02255 [Polyangiaceae bacterium]|jgi:hypothetical protein|nr:hypothetical protein [Polyangiaceae bacterium]
MKTRCALLGLALAGCVPFDEARGPSPANAILTLRRTYERTAGTTLSESCTVNGNDMFGPFGKFSPSESAKPALVDTLWIRAAPSRIVIQAGFGHDEEQTRSAIGTNGSLHTWTQEVSVDDEGCWTRIWLSPRAGHRYFVDFTYRGNNACSATCVEPVGVDGGTISRPCPQPTSEEEDHLEVQKEGSGPRWGPAQSRDAPGR